MIWGVWTLTSWPNFANIKWTGDHILNPRGTLRSAAAWAAQPWQISLSYTQLVVSDLWCTLPISSWRNNLQQLRTISLSPLGYFSEIYELRGCIILFCVQPTHQILKAVLRGKAMPYNGSLFFFPTGELHLSIHDNIAELFQCRVNRRYLLPAQRQEAFGQHLSLDMSLLLVH